MSAFQDLTAGGISNNQNYIKLSCIDDNDKMRYKLTSECHFLPFDEDVSGQNLLYFPLQSLLMKVNVSAALIVRKIRDNYYRPSGPGEEHFIQQLQKLSLVNGPPEKMPFQKHPLYPEPVRTIFVTSERCNMNCIYCYNNSSGQGDLMTVETGRRTVDFIAANARKNHTGEIEVGFHGGGEPTVNWQVLKEITEYAGKVAEKYDLRLMSTICTNGMLSKTQVEWLAKHIKVVVISIDGPPEIHNRQRPAHNGEASFKKVAATIDRLTELEKPYIFRVTVTSFGEDKIPDIVEFFNTRFHPKTICMEPLFTCGRCISSDCMPPQPEAFINGHRNSAPLVKKYHVPLQYSGARSFFLDSIFCGVSGRNFFITPQGDVTSCIEVTNRNDPRSQVFFYGRMNNQTGEFEFDQERYRKLCSLQVQNYEPCRDCFARWHCSGDCPAKFPDLQKEKHTILNKYRCLVNKTLTQHQIIRDWDISAGSDTVSDEPAILAVRDLVPLNSKNRMNYISEDLHRQNQIYLEEIMNGQVTEADIPPQKSI